MSERKAAVLTLTNRRESRTEDKPEIWEARAVVVIERETGKKFLTKGGDYFKETLLRVDTFSSRRSRSDERISFEPSDIAAAEIYFANRAQHHRESEQRQAALKAWHATEPISLLVSIFTAQNDTRFVDTDALCKQVSERLDIETIRKMHKAIYGV